MKKYIFPFLAVFALLSACKQKSTPGAGVAAASLANTVDPICDMKLKETVKDTAHYQGKVYG
ncbi:MAG: hypothetical protein JNJ57_01230, partial [Saprospiraceae bacterium]|nr:hypothetical protein [Saprospiraceae bacterium]